MSGRTGKRGGGGAGAGPGPDGGVRAGDDAVWLYLDTDKKWSVSYTARKDAREASG